MDECAILQVKKSSVFSGFTSAASLIRETATSSASPTSDTISKFGGFQSASLLMPSNATKTGDKDSVTASKGVEYILVEDSSDSLPSTNKRLSPVELIPILTLEEGGHRSRHESPTCTSSERQILVESPNSGLPVEELSNFSSVETCSRSEERPHPISVWEDSPCTTSTSKK